MARLEGEDKIKNSQNDKVEIQDEATKLVEETKEVGDQENEDLVEPTGDEENKKAKSEDTEWKEVHEAVVRLEQLEESFGGPLIDINEDVKEPEQIVQKKIHHTEMYGYD